MINQFKLICIAAFVAASISTGLTSCNLEKSLGNSGCIVSTSGNVTTSASLCVTCDSINAKAQGLLKKVFPNAGNDLLSRPKSK